MIKNKPFSHWSLYLKNNNCLLDVCVYCKGRGGDAMKVNVSVGRHFVNYRWGREGKLKYCSGYFYSTQKAKTCISFYYNQQQKFSDFIYLLFVLRFFSLSSAIQSPSQSRAAITASVTWWRIIHFNPSHHLLRLCQGQEILPCDKWQYLVSSWPIRSKGI